MKNDNLKIEVNLDVKLFHDIVGLSESEAKETAFMLKNVISPNVIKKLNYFVEFVSENKQFIDKFKDYLKTKK